MSDNIDKDKYWQILSMYIDLGTETLLNLFLNYIRKSSYDVSSFFNSQEIKAALINLKRRNILKDPEFNKVARSIPNLNEMDITLLIKLVTNLFGDQVNVCNIQPGVMDYTIGADIYRMRTFRNKLFHLSKAQISQSKFEQDWKKISDTLLRVAGEINEDEKVRLKGKIDKYRGKRTDAATREKLGEMLEEWEKQYLSLKEKASDLCKRMESFGFLLQTTPKQYIRYLKLLFECGKKVLLEILSRECDREKQTLANILHLNQVTLKRKITNEDDINKVYPENSSDAIPDRWSVSLLATVILTAFSRLDTEDKSKLEHLRNAAEENQCSETASKLLLETDYLFEQSTRLTHSITFLAANIDNESRRNCSRYIEQYPKMEIYDDAIKYLRELKNQGENIKDLDELNKELIIELKSYLTEMENSGSDFEMPRELHIRIATICEDKITEKLAEDSLEAAYLITVPANLSSYGVKKEWEKIIAWLSSRLGVNVTMIKRNCVTLVISCSSCTGMLQLLDDIDSNLEKSCGRLSDELSYICNEVVVLRGNITIESLFYARENQNSKRDVVKSGFDITLKSETSDGIQHVPATLSDSDASSSFDQILEVMSTQKLEKTSLPVILGGISSLLEETVSQDDEDICKEGTHDLEEDSALQSDTYLRRGEQDSDKGEKDVVEDKIVKLESEHKIDMTDVQKDLLNLYERINKIREDLDSTEIELNNDYRSLLEVSEKTYARQKSTEIWQIKDRDDKPYKEYQTKSIDIRTPKQKISAILKKVLQSLRKLVTCLKEVLSSWKKKAKCFYFRLADTKDIETFATRCSKVKLILNDLQHDILPLIFNIYVDCGWSTNKIQQKEQRLEDLSNVLLNSTFVIEEQNDCFMRLYKENQLPVFTVRILSAENFSQASLVEAILVPESDLKDLDAFEDEMQKLIREKDNHIKLSSNRIYLTRHQRSASFKRLTLTNVKELVHDVILYRVVFFTTIAERRLWTLSLPIAVLSASNADQEILPFISIVRNLLGTDTKKITSKSQERLSWKELEEMVQLKFIQLYVKSLRPLTEGNLQHLQKCIFGEIDISNEESMTVDIDSSSLIHNFWIWIHGICKLIKQYFLEFWMDGLIIGFISETDAKWILTQFERCMSGTFILCFSEPDLQRGEDLQCTNSHLKAYVLRIQETNVHISHLETSKFRKLGKYLNEKDTAYPLSRWEILVQKCRIPLPDKVKIENAVNPGIAFLNEFENHFMLPDLAEYLEQSGMHEGREILHADDADLLHDSVLSLPVETFRQIGLALKDPYARLLYGEQIPCWDYIRRYKGNFTEKDQMNIRRSSSPGEKFLEVFDDFRLKIADLREICSDLNLHRIVELLDSRKQEVYLEKAIVDIDIGGAKELQDKSLVDILREKRNTKGECMLKYIYPGKYSLEELEEKYAS